MSPGPIQTTISPIDQSPACTRPLLSSEQLDTVIGDAVKAQKAWKKVSLDERIAIAEHWMVGQVLLSSIETSVTELNSKQVEFERLKDVLGEEITLQMGRWVEHHVRHPQSVHPLILLAFSPFQTHFPSCR